MQIVRKADSAVGNTKTFTVPDGKFWKVLYSHTAYTSTGTAGNRQFNISVKASGSADAFDSAAGPVQAASLIRHYNGATGGNFREATFYNNECNVPLPNELILLAGDTITFEDVTDVDALDTLSVNLTVIEGPLSLAGTV